LADKDKDRMISLDELKDLLYAMEDNKNNWSVNRGLIDIEDSKIKYE
jgi:hypothetical protein